ncbi:hypothetical protein LCGC14_3157610 [marine sediment metagenome]|uniref:Uncharacterized protein n=1 Tax=marine sediment metagenome TaxID=412755 RepID=A0A0F8WG85_9ZZZZ
MELFNEAIKGINKQIKDLKSAIKDLEKEKQEIIKESGMIVEHPLQKIIKKYKRVANLKPPTDEQCQTLIDLYGEQKVIEKLEAMNNHKELTKKVYCYATIKNWLDRDIQKAISTGQRMPNQSKEYWDKFRKDAAQAETERDKWGPGFLTSELRKK